MFDDVKKEPEDIFAETDKNAPQVAPPTQPQVAQAPAPDSLPAEPAAAPAPNPQAAGTSSGQPHSIVDQRNRQISSEKGGFPWKPIVIVVAIIVIITAAFLLSMRILGSETDTAPVPPDKIEAPAVNEVTEPIPEPVVEDEPEPEPVIDEPIPEPDPDTDRDGLTDAEEAALGTDPELTDTDGDGLFDFEEVNTWKTDPLDVDTDGDTFEDGVEVTGGYNPLGEGKILELPTEDNETETDEDPDLK